jgi:hypothetical protein
MTIKIHPCKQKPLTAILVILFIAALGYLFQSYFQGYWGLPAVIILSFSLRNFFFPTTYYLTPQTLQVQTLWRKQNFPWERFKSLRIYPNGLYLSPYLKPKGWEPFRGIFLLLDKYNLAKAKEFIELKLKI